MSDLPAPPTLYQLFVPVDTVVPLVDNVVSWEFRDGVWFIVDSSRAVYAFRIGPQGLQIRPKT